MNLQLWILQILNQYAFVCHLQALLHFVYWDVLPDFEELTGLNSKWASTLMSQHLLAAADRYGLDRLRLICEDKLCKDIAINTVATTLALAEQHHCFQLKSSCLKFVALPENLRGNLYAQPTFGHCVYEFIVLRHFLSSFSCGHDNVEACYIFSGMFLSMVNFGCKCFHFFSQVFLI